MNNMTSQVWFGGWNCDIGRLGPPLGRPLVRVNIQNIYKFGYPSDSLVSAGLPGPGPLLPWTALASPGSPWPPWNPPWPGPAARRRRIHRASTYIYIYIYLYVYMYNITYGVRMETIILGPFPLVFTHAHGSWVTGPPSQMSGPVSATHVGDAQQWQSWVDVHVHVC